MILSLKGTNMYASMIFLAGVVAGTVGQQQLPDIDVFFAPHDASTPVSAVGE